MSDGEPTVKATAHGEFETLLLYLANSRGFDFAAYKRSTLERRIRKRMMTVGVERMGDYLDYLQVHPEEFPELFTTILINVTGFFRDETAWESLRQEVIPRILEGKPPREGIRVWSAGCASGEEAYSLAMLFAEALGEEQFRARVKIYATDIDDEALSVARLATYTETHMEGVPEALRSKYFERSEDSYSFRKDLRRSVIFGRHNLLEDAPISRLDLLVCRNTLMYFNVEAQDRILARFEFALKPGGYLFLGKAEMMMSRFKALVSHNTKSRIFVKEGEAQAAWGDLQPAEVGNEGASISGEARRTLDALLERDPRAEIIVAEDGTVTAANERARTLFAMARSDIGRPLRDLEVSFRPVELRSLIQQAHEELRAVTAREVPWAARGEQLYLDAMVLPLVDEQGQSLGTRVSFSDVTRYRQLQSELKKANQELETALEELQSSNEELETTNEELQSTIEELETTNEELQATNEELETINQELEVTNEELQATSAQLRARGAEVEVANQLMESTLKALRDGVVALDSKLRVLAWNARAEDLWGARLGEVRGMPFFELDIGLPMQRLRNPIASCLRGATERCDVPVDAVNRRGKPVRVVVTCSPMRGAMDEVHGVVLLMSQRDEEVQ